MCSPCLTHNTSMCALRTKYMETQVGIPPETHQLWWCLENCVIPSDVAYTFCTDVLGFTPRMHVMLGSGSVLRLLYMLRLLRNYQQYCRIDMHIDRDFACFIPLYAVPCLEHETSIFVKGWTVCRRLWQYGSCLTEVIPLKCVLTNMVNITHGRHGSHTCLILHIVTYPLDHCDFCAIYPMIGKH